VFAPEVAPNPARETRYVNVELEDHPAGEPLAVGEPYTLAFGVDVRALPGAVASTHFPDTLVFAPDSDVGEVQLTVQLNGTDFDISEATRPLRVPRRGKARAKARFDIVPRHEGPSTLRATLHHEGNLVQQIELTFAVGGATREPVRVTATGRPLSAAQGLRPRPLALSLRPSPAGGYDCTMWKPVSKEARLPIQQGLLAKAADVARQALLRVVMHEEGGEPVFQTGIDIPEAAEREALRVMARAGARLFQQLFYGPDAGPDARQIGDALRRRAGDRTGHLALQILATKAPLPWSMLYIGDASAGATLEWDNFLGMRHVIEQFPAQPDDSVFDSVIPSDRPALAVGINVHTGIDAQMEADHVARQRAFWERAAAARRVRVTPRTTGAEVVSALGDASTADQILYFYCHAESAGLDDRAGPDASCLVLSDASLSLGDLNLDAPTSVRLPGTPLVFINACESAQLSPAFYDGFVPYFMDKGARGVIGTECRMPACFATEWAGRFFERFLDGAPLGEAVLELRREFLREHRNPLGLLYSVHCDGDTRIEPALAAASG
jgi:hypothetical protein